MPDTFPPKFGGKFKFYRTRDLARFLTRLHERERLSWRDIAQEKFGNGIPPGTLCRIAKGDYDPRHNSIREKLGLPKTIRLVVLNGHIREGAVVLGHSRRCAWRRCRVHFVGDASRRYCSDECGRQAHADQRKRSAKERRERARRLVARKRNEKRRK